MPVRVNELTAKVAQLTAPVKYGAAMATQRTFGERIRYARTQSGLSQSELARGIARITKNKITKSLVSAWETEKIKNPQNTTLLAIQAVTGFRMEWLVTGKGNERVSLDSPLPQGSADLDLAKLERAIATAVTTGGESGAVARVAAGLYQMLVESPDLKAPALSRLAVLFKAA
jgi:transcriptional regulator with XRE-family HTH domain